MSTDARITDTKMLDIVRRVVAATADYLGLEVPAPYGTSQCILASRVVVEVLTRLGVGAAILPTRLVVHDTAALRFIKEHGADEGRRRWRAGDRSAELGTLKGTDPRAPFGAWNGVYNGHLVAIVDDGWIADASLGQHSAPERQFHLHSRVAFVGPSWRTAGHVATLQSGVAALYSPVTTDRTYQESNYWKSDIPSITAGVESNALRPDYRRADVAATRLSGKVGRNQPCPCGSAVKYKRCCGR